MDIAIFAEGEAAPSHEPPRAGTLMDVAIFGMGYVGLVQAAALAEAGNRVFAVDSDAEKIAMLQAGSVPIFEPGLEAVVRDNLAAGRLRFSDDADACVRAVSLVFIAVGTPSGADGAADLSHVLAVADRIGASMEAPTVVVVKSTTPVGTAEKVEARIAQALAARGRGDLAFDVVSNPEFLKEGSALSDFQKPDRVVIGVRSRRAEAVLRELYGPFVRSGGKFVVMDVRSAELTKYAANSLLAAKISFMNEIANLADRFGADVEQVRLGMGSDPRIGQHFLHAGVGYGGACFPKDVRALVRAAEEAGFDPAVLRAVEQRNEAQKRLMFDKISRCFGGRLEGCTFAVWGLAFKPNTNDMREAPSRTLIEALWAAGAHVRAYDPEAVEECRRLYGGRADLTLVDRKEAALDGADALVVMTEWHAFRSPSFEAIGAALRRKTIFDGRNIYDPSTVRRFGLTLVGIGREAASPGACGPSTGN